MVRDSEISLIRSKSGSKGGKTTQTKNKNFAKAKIKANTEYEIEYESEYESDVLESEKKTPNMSKQTEIIPLPFNTPEFEEIWAEWLKYRKERRWGVYTPTGLKRTFKKLLRDCGGDCSTAVEMIDTAISCTWQGIFPLKPILNGKTNKRESPAVGKEIEFDRP